MPVTIFSQKNTPIKVTALRRCMEEVLRYSHKRGAFLEISLVGRTRMVQLNRKFRGKNHVTDVLSFPLDAEPPSAVFPWHLGEIVIATELAKRQARRARRIVTQQVLRLCVHGFIHLTGLDHEAGSAMKKRFEAAEKKFLHHLKKKGLFQWDGSLQF